jgi:VanZ family protein
LQTFGRENGCHQLRPNYLGNTMFVRPLAKYWGPVVAWMVLIFVGSGDLMSAEHTSRFLIPFLLWIKPDISVETLAQIHFCIRKAGHLTEYAILALLLYRAVFRGTTVKWVPRTLFVGAWIACVLVAMSDEFHQSFVQSRGASPWDVMIDSAGAIFGLLIYAGFAWRKSGKENRGL